MSTISAKFLLTESKVSIWWHTSPQICNKPKRNQYNNSVLLQGNLCTLFIYSEEIQKHFRPHISRHNSFYGSDSNNILNAGRVLLTETELKHGDVGKWPKILHVFLVGR